MHEHMPEDPPWIELIARAAVHDIDGVLELCDPQISWETQWPGLGPVCQGREGVRSFFATIEEAIADVVPSFTILTEATERVLVEMRLEGHGRESGTPVAMTVYDIWTFQDNLLRRRQTFYDRNDAIVALAAPLDAAQVRPTAG